MTSFGWRRSGGPRAPTVAIPARSEETEERVRWWVIRHGDRRGKYAVHPKPGWGTNIEAHESRYCGFCVFVVVVFSVRKLQSYN